MATLSFVQELANLVGEDGSSKFFIDDGNLSAPFTKMIEAWITSSTKVLRSVIISSAPRASTYSGAVKFVLKLCGASWR